MSLVHEWAVTGGVCVCVCQPDKMEIKSVLQHVLFHHREALLSLVLCRSLSFSVGRIQWEFRLRKKHWQALFDPASFDPLSYCLHWR